MNLCCHCLEEVCGVLEMWIGKVCDGCYFVVVRVLVVVHSIGELKWSVCVVCKVGMEYVGEIGVVGEDVLLLFFSCLQCVGFWVV